MNNEVNNRFTTCKYWLTVILMAIFALYVTGNTLASTVIQEHRSLQTAVKHYLDDRLADKYELTFKFGRLDKRLRLEKCQTELKVFTTGNRTPIGSVSIGVRCENPTWRVRLPVHVYAYTDVLVAKHPIPRGEMITKNHLQYERHNVGRYHAGVYTDMESLVGMIAKRPIRDTAVITARMVKPRLLVTRGEMITIIAEGNGLKIRTSGKALMDGQQGQVIQIVNNRSGRKLSGEVVARSTVRVKM